MFGKLLEYAENFFNWIEKDKEKQAQKLREKRAAYLEERRKQAEAESKKALKQKLERRAAERAQKLSAYTTIEEFKSIIESPQYKKLSDKERDTFLRRAGELRRKNPQFSKDYKDWQNEKSKKATVSLKAKTMSHQKVYKV